MTKYELKITVENIRTMSFVDVNLHINNEKEYIYICSFESNGVTYDD